MQKKPDPFFKKIKQNGRGKSFQSKTAANTSLTPTSLTPTSLTHTSWEESHQWYQNSVGAEGHYYHRQIIMPGVLRLLESPLSILDLACGTGILAHYLTKESATQGVYYMGVDAAPSLLQKGQQQQDCASQHYHLADVTQPLKIAKRDFSHATLILALQNIEKPALVFQQAAKHLQLGGKFIIVLNHPCFRIPRQSSWQVDESKKIQYRRLDQYLSSLKIPIRTHPGKGALSQETLSFHHPLSSYINWLSQAGFMLDRMEEWCSDKVSAGKNAKMENSSRAEFPLFLAMRATLVSSSFHAPKEK